MAKSFAITFRQIEAFKAILETGSVTAAAASMNVSQPSVSRLLKDFEAGIEFSLFTRTKGRLIATPEAHLLHDEIRKYFRNLQKLTRTAGEIRALARGQLRIGAYIALSIAVTPKVIRTFSRAYPDLDVSCTTAQSGQIVDLIDSRFVELGIVDPQAVTGAVKIERRWQFRCVCALPAGHRLARSDRISTEQLADETVIGLERDFLARYPAGAGLYTAIAPRIRVQVHHSVVACALVAEGLGAAIVDPFTAQHCRPRGIEVRPLDVAIPFEMCIASSQEGPLSLAAREYLDLFYREIDGMCAHLPYLERLE